MPRPTPRDTCSAPVQDVAIGQLQLSPSVSSSSSSSSLQISPVQEVDEPSQDFPRLLGTLQMPPLQTDDNPASARNNGVGPPMAPMPIEGADCEDVPQGGVHGASLRPTEERSSARDAVPTRAKTIRRLNSLMNVTKVKTSVPDGSEKAFGKAVFQDHRWEEALRYLHAQPDWCREKAASILCQGAKTFGIWQLNEQAIEGLVRQVLGEEGAVSPAMASWLLSHSQDAVISRDMGQLASRTVGRSTTMTDMDMKDFRAKKEADASRKLTVDEWKASLVDAGMLKKFKLCLSFLILLIGVLYACKVCFQMYPEAISIFGWPIFVARMCGMMIACWTAVLYLTMARGFLTKLHKCTSKRGVIVTILDGHKELHILAGKTLFVAGLVHAVAHCIGTVPGILTSTVDKLNGVLGCANPSTTSGFLPVNLKGLQWPKCPIEEIPKSELAVLFGTMPGLTGVLLLVLLAITAYTGRQVGRKQHFDIFWYVHNIAITVWPILLFLHGSNAWVGVGFPLVVFTASVPILLYLCDRLLRYYRYYFTADRISSCTIRPGRNDSADGALTYVRLEFPDPVFRHRFRPGMYAFLNMPEYAPFQWHPFTICSGLEDPTVDFLIAGVGDWTRELAKRSMEAADGTTMLPKIAIDGPFTAPTQSALQKKVIVAVGAGVGITPFLSLMSSIVSLLEDGDASTDPPLKEAHFFWMTRSMDEFLFGRKQFSKILQLPHIRDKVFLHLHMTGQPAEKDPAAYVFREALRRQSEIDRSAFQSKLKNADGESTIQLLSGAQLPWCWIDGTKQDVLWLSQMVENVDEVQQGECMFSKRFSTVAGKNKSADDSDLERGMGMRSVKEGADWMVPVVFGRPDFATELRSIGKARPGMNVDVYVCGNDAVVKNLQEVSIVCNEHAERDMHENGAPRQQYAVHFERFG